MLKRIFVVFVLVALFLASDPMKIVSVDSRIAAAKPTPSISAHLLVLGGPPCLPDEPCGPQGPRQNRQI